MQPTFWQINPKLWGFDGKCFSFKAQLWNNQKAFSLTDLRPPSWLIGGW